MTSKVRRSQFIDSELIADSIHAAFQRGNIYHTTAKDSDRQKLRTCLANLLCDYRQQYAQTVLPETHKENIQHICDELTTKFGSFLCDKRFRIGTAQKALNLYLKYMWCLDRVSIPPHCPFDGIIINMLSLPAKYAHIQWTKLKTLGEYQALVDAAEIKMRAENYSSLAEWELEVYERRGTKVQP